MSCCQCEGIEREFNDAVARRMLRRFRRKGPDRTTRMLIDAIRRDLEARDARDVALLDVGAGIGAIHHMLLDGRVARAVHIDASTAHMSAAREEAERRGHTPRVEFLNGDFVALAEDLSAADVVTLDRVICCYPDMNLLVRRSAQKARMLFGAVYPRGTRLMAIAAASINAFLRLRRSSFRFFQHQPAAIDATLRNAGLSPRSLQRTLMWEVVVYERAVVAA